MTLETRVNALERMMEQLAYAQMKTEISIQRLSNEMREFKDEMREFKNEMRAEMKYWFRQWGALSKKMGTLVEDLVVPGLISALRKKFQCKEEDVLFSGMRVKKRGEKKDDIKEFDAIIECTDYFFVNETKGTIKHKDVLDFKEFLDSGGLVKFFPQVKQKTIVPVMSSLYMSEEIVAFLTKNNILAMHATEISMEIVNFDQLKDKFLKKEKR